MNPADALAWLLTYALHSTLLLGGILILTSRGVIRSHHLRDLFWKAAVLGGIVTATAQSGLHTVAWTDTLPLPASRPGLVGAGLPMPMPLTYRVADRGAADAAAAAGPLSPAPVIFALWWGIASAALIGLALAHLRLSRRLSRRAPIGPSPLHSLLDELRGAAGIRRPIRLTCSEGLASPVALGRSEICVPRAVLTELDAAQQRSVLAHELAHLERRDPTWLAIACVIERAFFFQPLNRLARRRIQESAEYLCDDWAVRSTGSGITMAQSLMKVAEWMTDGASPVPLAGMAENPSQLVTRVKRLVEHRGTFEVRRAWAVPVACALLVLTAAAVPGFAGSAGAASQEPAAQEPRPKAPRPRPVPRVDVRRVTDAAVATAQAAVMEMHTKIDIDPATIRDGVRLGLKMAKLARDPELAAAGRIDTVGIAALIAALRDSDAGVRRAAAHSLGNIEDRRATEPLAAVLRDSDVEVRRNAAWALGNIQDPRAVDALIGALKDADAEVRKSAAWALGEIQDARAADGLAGALRDESVEVRKSAAWALGEMELTAAPPALIEAMRDQNPEVRKTAVWAVGEMGDARAVPALRAMLDDSSAEVRHGAVHALSEIRDAAALQALIDAMKSKDADVRREAAAALGDRN